MPPEDSQSSHVPVEQGSAPKAPAVRHHDTRWVLRSCPMLLSNKATLRKPLPASNLPRKNILPPQNELTKLTELTKPTSPRLQPTTKKYTPPAKRTDKTDRTDETPPLTAIRPTTKKYTPPAKRTTETTKTSETHLESSAEVRFAAAPLIVLEVMAPGGHHQLSRVILSIEVGDALPTFENDKDGGPFWVPAPRQTRKLGPDEAVPYQPRGAAPRRAGRDALCASLESFVPARAADSTLSPLSKRSASDSCDKTAHPLPLHKFPCQNERCVIEVMPSEQRTHPQPTIR
jgi:hypothetical protein